MIFGCRHTDSGYFYLFYYRIYSPNRDRCWDWTGYSNYNIFRRYCAQTTDTFRYYCIFEHIDVYLNEVYTLHRPSRLHHHCDIDNLLDNLKYEGFIFWSSYYSHRNYSSIAIEIN